ncbi:hydroquinone glucosyltransferase-like [Prosopis cineraria]|uniref:hydroquinone glucosyltransferase-like n=1 Tax=Prosopis cineraria TaxID=364024 RepID=UPI00240E9E2E|nr:hydroquinone glucosyltransferase-like [Prosopis cineraria]
MEKSTRIAVLPSPGFSHVVPILEFSKRLVHLHPDFHVTCIVPAFGSHSSSSIAYLQTLPSNIDSILLPPIPKEKIPQDTVPATQIEGTVTLSLPYIRQELKSMKSKTGLAALVADIFALDTLAFAEELNVFSYIYLPQAAMVFSLYYYSLMLDETVSSEFRDLKEPIKIPGCLPIHGRDLPVIFQDRSSLGYKMFLERSRKFCLADGVLFNSFEELEPETIRALREEIGKKKPQVYAVGPIIQSGLNSSNETTDSGSDCLTWLNNQPPKSVLYVSFGSGGTLSQDQLNELAYGLGLSETRFLWVLRSPSKVSSAAYLDTINENPLDFLPEGFLERTKERGLVVPSWAPQIPILKHSSVGGFLSHCGWNSTLESIIHGVPFIAWPLFAEQSMNAVLLTHGLKVAVWPTANDDDGMVKKEEISEAIRTLMEGEESDEIRARINVLKVKAVKALKKDGPSTMALSVFAESLRN